MCGGRWERMDEGVAASAKDTKYTWGHSGVQYTHSVYSVWGDTGPKQQYCRVRCVSGVHALCVQPRERAGVRRTGQSPCPALHLMLRSGQTRALRGRQAHHTQICRGVLAGSTDRDGASHTVRTHHITLCCCQVALGAHCGAHRHSREEIGANAGKWSSGSNSQRAKGQHNAQIACGSQQRSVSAPCMLVVLQQLLASAHSCQARCVLRVKLAYKIWHVNGDGSVSLQESGAWQAHRVRAPRRQQRCT